MPELNGFEVIAEAGVDAMPVIVFVTAHDAFALQAFEVQALDYLLKPFDDERFHRVLGRARQQVRARLSGAPDSRLETLLKRYTEYEAPAMTRIMVKNAGVVFFQPVDEIDWIEAADYFVKLHVAGKAHLVAETLATLDKRLDPAHCMRVHRSAIVNLDRVQELRPDYRNRHIIVLTNGERVPLSRSRRERLETALAGQTPSRRARSAESLEETDHPGKEQSDALQEVDCLWSLLFVDWIALFDPPLFCGCRIPDPQASCSSVMTTFPLLRPVATYRNASAICSNG